MGSAIKDAIGDTAGRIPTDTHGCIVSRNICKLSALAGCGSIPIAPVIFIANAGI